MLRLARTIAIGFVGATALSACATKGYVNRTVDREMVARVAADSAQSGDIAALRTDLTALRGELQTLRTEFGARITAMEDAVKFTFPVHFAYDDAAVRAEDQAALDRFASVVQKYYNGAQLTVEGFADPAGSARYNTALSRRRAESVKQYLVGKGLGDEQLKTVGYGEARQVRPGAAGDAPGAELNRRVVFVVETPGAGTVTAMAQQGN
ncbi:MAG TPA: OmpA family protein [Gemmatirosa sp.]|nr:OmpA family protein [Gemmatirosa sp.]